MNELLNLKKYQMYLLIMVLAAAHIVIGFPGAMTPDAMNQYQQALSNVYSDHHPPMLAWVWKALNYVWHGSAGLYVFSLSMLWISVLLIYCAYNRVSKYAFLVIFMPFVAGVFSLSSTLVKDVIFANGFMLAMAIMSLHSAREKKLHYATTLLLITLIFFVAGVKHQAQYLIVPLCIWLGHLLFAGNIRGVLIFSSLLCLFVIEGNAYLKNEHASPGRGEQMRQLFDIAGIAVLSGDESVIPEVIKIQSNYSFEKLKRDYHPRWVDTLVYAGESSVFIMPENDEDFLQIDQAFYNAIEKHPFYYLLHRAKNFSQNILRYKHNEFGQSCCVDDLKELGVEPSNDTDIKIAARSYIRYTQLLFGSNLIFYMLAFYMLIKSSNNKFDPFYMPIFIAAVCCLLMVVLLFFATMASEYRYSYVIRLLAAFYAPVVIGLAKVKNPIFAR